MRGLEEGEGNQEEDSRVTAQGQPEAGVTSQNCPLYKASMLRKADTARIGSNCHQGPEAKTTHV